MKPFLQIVHGDPTPEEIAALVTALVTRPTPPEPHPQPSTWADHARALRHPLHHGPNAWRTSTLPRAARL